jgi:Flp pilus assembly protein TadD
MSKAALALFIAVLQPQAGRAADSFAQHQANALNAFKKGRYSEAVTEFRAAEKLNPHADGIHKDLGLALFQDKQFSEAVTELGAARAEHPADMQVLLALGTSLARLQRLDDAQAVFADLLRRYPNSAPLHLLWGQAYAAQAQDVPAEEEFREA